MVIVWLKVPIYFSKKPQPFLLRILLQLTKLAIGVSMLTLNAEMLIMLKGHYLGEGLRVDTDNS